MAKRPILTDVTSLTNSSNINAINQNWDAIQEAFDNTLSLDGSIPNAMNSDLDLNGNSLLNVGTIDVDDLTLNGQQVTGLATVPEWRSSWASGQSYVVNDLVKIAGNVYICLVAHTAGGDFSTDLTAGNWELFVPKGDSGSGTGDMLSTNNLSDVDNPATSRTNLGLGSVAVENTVPVAKGGTGATDATTARTNLSAQTLNANLTDISGITPTKGRLIVGNGTNWVDLGVSTDGYSLEADSSATSGLKWNVNKAVAIAAGDLNQPKVKGEALDLSLSFVDTTGTTWGQLTDLDRAEWVEAVITVRSTSATGNNLQLRLSSDGGSTWSAASTVSDAGVQGDTVVVFHVYVNMRTGAYRAHRAFQPTEGASAAGFKTGTLALTGKPDSLGIRCDSGTGETYATIKIIGGVSP